MRNRGRKKLPTVQNEIWTKGTILRTFTGSYFFALETNLDKKAGIGTKNLILLSIILGVMGEKCIGEVIPTRNCAGKNWPI